MNEDNGRENIDGIDSVASHGAGISTLTSGDLPVEQPGKTRTFSLAQMLVEAGILSSETVAGAQETATLERQPLGRILIREGLVLPRDLATLTALHIGVAMVDLRSLRTLAT